jgi:hypothetical protein
LLDEGWKQGAIGGIPQHLASRLAASERIVGQSEWNKPYTEKECSALDRTREEEGLPTPPLSMYVEMSSQTSMMGVCGGTTESGE